MLYEIKNRFTLEVIFSLDCDSMKLCVEAAVEKKVNLSYSNLSYSNLSGSDLRGSDLSYSDLRGSNLSGSDLSYSNLSGSDLSYSNLSGSNLSYSNLSYSDLRGSHLSGSKDAEKAIAKTRILPEGSIIGWKAAGGHIVKLLIPMEAKRSHAFGRKCRAEYVDVLEVEGADVAVTNQHGPVTEYRAGQRVHPDKWCENWQDECSNGIHFFITREEAEEWL